MTPVALRRCGLKSARQRSGFSLVEMLVVLAILAILAVLSLPSIKGVLGSMDLKGAANVVTAQLDLARQTASTRNTPVEVRIYQDTSMPDITASKAYSYRIIAVVVPSTNGGTTPDEFVSPGLALPGDIILDQTTASVTQDYSSLLDSTNAAFKNDAGGNARFVAMEATTAPFQLVKKPYMKFTFLPNGTVYLPNDNTNTGLWCLTLRNLNAKASTTPVGPAKNFVTLVLDPSTSHVRIFQP